MRQRWYNGNRNRQLVGEEGFHQLGFCIAEVVHHQHGPWPAGPPPCGTDVARGARHTGGWRAPLDGDAVGRVAPASNLEDQALVGVLRVLAPFDTRTNDSTCPSYGPGDLQVHVDKITRRVAGHAPIVRHQLSATCDLGTPALFEGAPQTRFGQNSPQVLVHVLLDLGVVTHKAGIHQHDLAAGGLKELHQDDAGGHREHHRHQQHTHAGGRGLALAGPLFLGFLSGHDFVAGKSCGAYPGRPRCDKQKPGYRNGHPCASLSTATKNPVFQPGLHDFRWGCV